MASVKRKISSVSDDATSKKHHTGPEDDRLAIAKIQGVAADVADQDHNDAKYIYSTWSGISAVLSGMSNVDDLSDVPTFKLWSRLLLESLHRYKRIEMDRKDLRIWFEKQLSSTEFVASILQALRACQDADPQTLTPFYDFLVLSIAQSSITTSRRIQTRLQSDDIREALETAWRGQYQGNAHKTLLNSINSDDRVKAYGCMGVLYQSFGYGKSRIVHEMSAEVFAIPLNILAQEEENQDAFPPRDAPIASIFEAIDHAPNTKYCTQNFGKLGGLFQFFHLLFDAVLDAIQPLLPNVGHGASLPEQWRNYLQTEREELYQSICNKWHDWARTHGLNDDLKYAPLLDAAAKSFRHLIRAIVPEFHERHASRDDKIKLLVYIDEAQNLVSSREKDPLFDLTQRAIEQLTGTNPKGGRGPKLNNYATHFFTLFLSTASHAKDIDKPRNLSSTARVLSEERVDWLPPHTTMPFDCHRELAQKLTPGSYTLEEVAQFKFLVCMGRALWWAYFESLPGDMHVEVKAQKVRDMARTKLTAMSGWTDVKRGSLLDNDRPGFAVLDVLLNLDYKPTRDSNVQADLVARHLRTAYFVPTHRESFYSGYPSEPVVSLVALELVDDLQARLARELKKGDALVHLFSDLQAYGAIDMGHHGENVGKMLLICAYMDAVRNLNWRSYPESSYSDGCPLLLFLDSLFALRFTDTWKACRPNNIPSQSAHESQTLAEAFADAWVRFFHFVRAADTSATTTEMARIALIRGAAVIGLRNDSQIHVMIPIVRKKGDKLTEQNMSVLLVQFRSRTKAGTSNQDLIDANQLGVFPTLKNGRFRVPGHPSPPIESRKGNSNPCPSDASLAPQLTEDKARDSLSRPYITLVMELGVRDRQSSTTHHAAPSPTTAGAHGKAEHPSSLTATPDVFKIPAPGRGRNGSPNDLIPMHRRYSLIAYGCSSTTYRCVGDDDRERLSRLLHWSDLLHHTPRPHLCRQIIGMAPFWGMEDGGYDWIQGSYFPSEIPVREEEDIEGVAIVEVTDSDGSDEEGDA